MTTSPTLQLIKSSQVESKLHVQMLMQEVIAAGGEGLIFRKPGSKYSEQDSFLQLTVCSNEFTQRVAS